MSAVVNAYKKVVLEVRGGTLRPVYLLHGEEDFFIDRLEAEIEAAALAEHERDFNLSVLYARDVDPDQVIDACLRYPMMAERQVVLLREAQLWRIETLERLASYFAKPTPTTVLVVSYRHKKVDGRRKVLKTVQDGKGVVFLSDKVKEEELPALFTQLAKRQDRKLGPDEARLLAAHLGADLAKAVKEVEKLCILTEPKGAITADMIQRVIGISREHNVFELQNAIGMRDVVKAQRIAMYFASDPRNHPLPMTIGFLHGYFTKLAIAHRMQGRNPQEMAAAMKVSPYFVKDYLAHAQNYTLGRVVMAQRLLRQMDLRSKGLGGDDDHGELLREFVARVMT